MPKFTIKRKPVLDAWDQCRLDFPQHLHDGALDTLLDTIREEMIKLGYTHEEVFKISLSNITVEVGGDYDGACVDYVVTCKKSQKIIDEELERHNKKVDEYNAWRNKNMGKIHAEYERVRKLKKTASVNWRIHQLESLINGD